MIFGDDAGALDALKERAKLAVMQKLVRLAESDQVPATQRACYVMKAAHAEMVLAGGSSLWIENEAEVRGYTPFQMARIIAFMADEAIELEMLRTRANVAIEQAPDESAVIAALAQIGAALPNQV